MKPFFKELFEYSHHCNQKLAEVMITNPDQVSEKAVILFNHILNAHQIWNSRIEPDQTTFGVWELHPSQELKSIDLTNYAKSLLILDQYDFDQTIQYKNTSGQEFSNSILDVLFHIINHSTYHRAQIASKFKEHGLAPLETDFIKYKR